MLVKTKTAPQTVWLSPTAPESITPYSLTLVLAYLQYYTPKRLQNGRFLAVEHLRNLAKWIGHPVPQLRSLQQHKILALHFVLLRAAGFIPDRAAHPTPQPAVTRWLHSTSTEAIEVLLQAATDATIWEHACAGLNLETTIGPDHTAYVQQSLSRQLALPPSPPQNLLRLKTEQEDAWQFYIPPSLPLWLHFDLRQLGEWTPGADLICTPLTIAAAVQRGYGLETIQWLLETAAQENLPQSHTKQLQQWTRRANAYKLRPVHLLSTAQPDQMAALLRQKRMRDHVIEHLSPRHAIVSETIVPSLEKWLAEQNYPLWQQATKQNPSVQVPVSEQTGVQWLGLRLLIGLGEIIHCPYPSPHALFAQLDACLDPAAQTELEAIAADLLHGLREAVRGRDAFFPARQPVAPETIDLIRQALWHDTSLQIEYQPLGSSQPSWREVQPLSLEQRRGLYYLHAYCLRTETNLTFRLDRIHNIQ